ncbi:GIY-YIG nuclease family protein [Flavobacterium sp. I3-2]|uniref:GIY-YIG nuclease family protein n=1 Tax=Flavobacterium sp. I3-2 TaxID=2748319 RepID=UPI0015B33A89|nr:GIY-YIG nuclease family protein [Flavobacterium sp. I3-2]
MNKIYRIFNRNTLQSYVGSTTRDVDTRFREHLQGTAKKVDTKFFKAIEHFGAQAFEIQLLEEVESTDELAEREVHYIEAFDSMRNGYNSDRGGGFRKTIYQFEIGNQEHIATYDTLQEAADAVNASRKSISNACLGYNKTCKGFVRLQTNLDTFL